MNLYEAFLVLLWSSLFAASDAVSRTFRTYAEPNCTGASTTDKYDVASHQGSTTCFNAPGSKYSTLDQWCDERNAQYNQAVFSGATCDGSSTQQSFPLGQCANAVTGVADDQGMVIVTCDFSQSQPCFSRDTHAVLASGEAILMTSLRSGDWVYDGPHSIARVIVNQHKAAHLSSPLLKVEHARGSITLTPDHVLHVDGLFVAAREVLVGSKLGTSNVSCITPITGGVINPLTTSGKIMADGVLACTYPDWIASYMLGRSTTSASSLISFLFPATTQAYYDAHLEHFFHWSSPKLVHLKNALPTLLVSPVFVVGDLLVAAGFVAFSLSSLKGLVVLFTLVSALKSPVSNRPRIETLFLRLFRTLIG